MNFFKKIELAETLGSELARLEARRAKLAEKLDAAGVALDSARSEQIEHLIVGDDDDAKPRSKVENRVLGCERDQSALRDAIHEIDERITGTRKRLAEARDAELRERTASERERAADAIEEAALQLGRSVEALAASFENLVAVIPDDSSARIYEPIMGPRQATPLEAARAILASGLFHRCPDAFVVEGPPVGFHVQISLPVSMHRRDGAFDRNILKNDDSVTFLPASGAAAVLAGPMRDAAAGLRAGTRALAAPTKAAPPAIIEPPPK